MAINFYFRGIRFTKNYLAKYLKALFYAADKGQLILTDGTKEIQFSRMPWVGGAHAWNEMELPSVIINAERMEMKALSFTKDVTDIVSDEIVAEDEYRHVGGDLVLSLSLSCRARTAVEKDQLLDIVCIYLAHPDAKDFLGQQDIVVHSNPSAGGESTLNLPGIDFPIFESSVALGLTGQWDARTEVTEARLSKIVVDVIAELEL